MRDGEGKKTALMISSGARIRTLSILLGAMRHCILIQNRTKLRRGAGVGGIRNTHCLVKWIFQDKQVGRKCSNNFLKLSFRWQLRIARKLADRRERWRGDRRALRPHGAERNAAGAQVWRHREISKSEGPGRKVWWDMSPQTLLQRPQQQDMSPPAGRQLCFHRTF